MVEGSEVSLRKDVISPAELGKQSDEAIKNLMTHLDGLPEYQEMAHKVLD